MAEIVIVEPSEVIRRVLRLILQGEGHTVLAAVDLTDEANDIITSHAPDVLVIGLADGLLDLTQALIHTQLAAVVAITRGERAVAGADRVVTRPFAVDTLLGAIDSALSSYGAPASEG